MDSFDIDELISQLTGISTETVEATRLGVIGTATAFAENRSMTYEQFAEVWHQERMTVAQAR